MKDYEFDAAVIGCGASGMAAALEICRNGYKTAIIERENEAGGILLQCIHNGFGLHEFKEELTGPEYAERFVNRLDESDIKYFLGTTVVNVKNKSGIKELFCFSSIYGAFAIKAKVIILAMGCRERNRGNLRIPGSRPAGIFTAGLAQRLVNIEGYIPGKNIVILGSGDIGLIMARRMKWVGCNVLGVIEIQKYPSGLTRNIVQCLNDFNIPLYLSHTITKIIGKKRIEAVEVTPLMDEVYQYEKSFYIECDTLLLSAGLVPENELSKNLGVKIHPHTNGPIVDSSLMTSVPGVFACGNVLHVHDLVDYATEEARRAGAHASAYLRSEKPVNQIQIKTGSNIRYINPSMASLDFDNVFYLRALIVKTSAELIININDKLFKKIKKPHIQPSEMISFSIKKDELKDLDAVSMEINIV